MRIMTFNLRFENDRDGENAWKNRREFVVQLIRSYAPSLLGTQEGTARQLTYLEQHLPRYTIHVPSSRVLDEKSQYPTLFYRKDQYRLLEGGEFWLSKSPDIHLSKDWDSAFPRMMNHGLFEEKETGNRFRACVTHLDHMGDEARKQQARIIRRWLTEQKEPAILMGDFNENPGGIVHEILTSAETGLRDTWQIKGREENENSMTSHDFSGIPQKGRLDWILVSRRFKVVDVAIIRDRQGNRYPSDHFPYQAQLEWS